MKTHLLRLNQFPLTADMWQVMSQFTKIDFLVITVIESATRRHSSYVLDGNSKPKLYIRFALKFQGLHFQMKLNVVDDIQLTNFQEE